MLKGTIVQEEFCIGVNKAKNLDATKLLHLGLGHNSENNLELLCRKKKIREESFNKLDLCKECVLSEQTKVSFGVGEHTSKWVLDYVHSDVWGPDSTAFIGGAH